jgi:hypothetical protein
MKTAALVVPAEMYAGFRDLFAALGFRGTWNVIVPYALVAPGAAGLALTWAAGAWPTPEPPPAHELKPAPKAMMNASRESRCFAGVRMT